MVVPAPRVQRVLGEVLILGNPDAAVVRPEARRARRDLGAQLVWIDDVLVHLKERDVVVEDLVQQDHELDEIGAGLLPEGLLAPAKQVGHQRGHAEGQGVGIELVVERVVPIR
jgi:hypothetical protein